MEEKGLSSTRVHELRAKFGRNILPKKEGRTWFTIFFAQFKSSLIYILILSAIISLVFGHYLDLVMIGAVVVLNVIMGFAQEYSAYRTFEMLRKLVDSRSMVVRDGIRQRIPREELVPGDVVVLGEGDKIPADGKLIEGNGMLLKESILTGEEEAIPKNIGQGVYMGTTVISGKGLMKVTGVGVSTELGKIGGGLVEIERGKTPIQLKLQDLSRKLGLLVIVICGVVYMLGVVNGADPIEMLRVSVVLSIAAIPEGLPVAVTIVLSIGARRILKKGGLVKKLVSVETLGVTTVICLDKTGTLTEGDMRVIRADLDDEDMVMTAVALANERKTNFEVSIWQYFSSTYGRKFSEIRRNLKKKYEQPFNSTQKYSHTIGHNGENEISCIIGAPEIVLQFCATDKSRWTEISKKIKDWAEEGLRIIVFASKSAGDLRRKTKFKWQGLIGVEDPVRQDARRTIKMAQSAGVAVKIITGDHLRTALRVAKDVGLSLKQEEVIDGTRMSKVQQERLGSVVKKIKLFARVTPAQKLTIVTALQDDGEVVAMTGDGVNDAQALKKADVGVVMGDSSDLSKDVGDLVLLDNNFKTIVRAIEEGRLIYSNIRKVVAYVLSDSFEEIVLIAGAMIVGLPAPLTVIQILWIHLICDGPPDIALGFEPKERDLMKLRPQDISRGSIFDLEILAITVGASLLIGLFALWLFKYSLDTTGNLAFSRTWVFSSIAAVDLIYVFAFRSLEKPFWSSLRIFFRNKFLWGSVFYGFVLLIVAVYLPVFNRMLGTVRLSLGHFSLQVVVGIGALVWVEIVKFFKRRAFRIGIWS